MAKHSAREVGGAHPGTLPCRIPAALSGAGADLEQPLVVYLAQQTGVSLAQALGPPHEIVVSKKRPVLGVVAVRLGVPPGPVGPRCLDRIGFAPSRGRWVLVRGIVQVIVLVRLAHRSEEHTSEL